MQTLCLFCLSLGGCRGGIGDTGGVTNSIGFANRSTVFLSMSNNAQRCVIGLPML